MRVFNSAAYKGPGKESGRNENTWSKVISVSWIQYSVEKLWKLL